MRRPMAEAIRAKLESASQHIPDSEAYEVVWMYPMWTEDGTYVAGKVWQHEDKLWRCRQAHDGQAAYAPSVYTASLWELIPMPDEEGTVDNPIAYSTGMALVEGKYYSENGIVYLCTRSTGVPVYNALADLVNLYVEVVT